MEANSSADVSGDVVFVTTQGAQVALDGTYRDLYTFNTNHENFGQKSYEITSDLLGEDIVIDKLGYGWFNTDYQYTSIQTATDGSRSERV